MPVIAVKFVSPKLRSAFAMSPRRKKKTVGNFSRPDLINCHKKLCQPVGDKIAKHPWIRIFIHNSPICRINFSRNAYGNVNIGLFYLRQTGTGKINSIFESIKIGHICVINKYVPNKNENQN